MKILITGGAGFIGSNLARFFHGWGHDVTVFDSFERGKVDRLESHLNFDQGRRLRVIPGDIRDEDAVVKACEDAEAIFHLAYVQGTQTFYEEPTRVIDVALRGILNVLEGCSGKGKELFLVSSSEVYQNPPEGYFPTAENVPLSVPDVTNSRYSYGGGKIASEIAAFAHSDYLKRLVVIRPHNIYGPDMGEEHVIPEFARRMISLPGGEDCNFIIQGSGQESRSFCHISDMIHGFGHLLMRGQHRGIYHVGNPEEVTIEGLAFRVANHFSRRIKIVHRALPQGSPSRRAPDIGKMRALGYNPMIPLAQGLPNTLDWYATHDR